MLPVAFKKCEALLCPISADNVVSTAPCRTYCCKNKPCGTLSHASAKSNKSFLRPQCARCDLWAGSPRMAVPQRTFQTRPWLRGVALPALTWMLCGPFSAVWWKSSSGSLADPQPGCPWLGSPVPSARLQFGARRSCQWSCSLAEGRGCGCSQAFPPEPPSTPALPWGGHCGPV